MEKFSIKEILSSAWKKTIANIWFLIPILLITYIISYALESSILGSLVSILTSFVLVSVFLRISRDEKVSFNNIFEGLTPKLFLQFFLLSILVSIFVLAGLILLIVPGLIVMIMMVFANYILMDRPASAIKTDSFWLAMKESHTLTKGHKWNIFVFLIVLIGINILGVIALGIGLLISVPVSAISLAILYDKFKAKNGHGKANSNTEAPIAS